MLEGVEIKPLVRHADDRGYFAELLRADEPIYSGFGQASVTVTYPGVVKAWHYHEKQDDLWTCLSGSIRVGLYDLRKESPTFGKTEELILGDYSPRLVKIPVGVAHGYKVLGNAPAIVVYFVTSPYNPADPDELRIPWDSPDIPFDWSTKNR
ncbi:MAG: spore coat protein [Dehalococcoidia bacterium]|nr:spore coat protein [Dehalococcoidia bacterium]